MIRVFDDTEVFIHAPAGIVTGGVELLHQLGHCLNENNIKAYICYYGDSPHIIPNEYSEYNVSMSSYVKESPHHIEVYTEVMTSLLWDNSRNTQKLFWWLSVDNYYHFNNLNITLFDEIIKRFCFYKRPIYTLLRYFFTHNYLQKSFSLRRLKKKNVTFAYQSEYIRSHLKKYGIRELVSLSDYINPNLQCNASECPKSDIVLFNPAKGFEFTSKLIDYNPDINWVPLKGYTRTELLSILKKAKLYIDFGNHPGKDRLPRECAISGCCVITGKRGSAAFKEDVYIPDKYKFNEKTDSIEKISNAIRNVLSNYEVLSLDFNEYREKISHEKDVFEKEVKSLFERN